MVNTTRGLSFSALLLAACANTGLPIENPVEVAPPAPSAPLRPSTVAIRGVAVGLVGSGLVLGNGPESVVVPSDGQFLFRNGVEVGQPYSVKVLHQPQLPSQTCTVLGGEGIAAADAAGDAIAVAVECSTQRFAVGGTVRGLIGSGLVIQDRGGAPVLVAEDGRFELPAKVASGSSYEVTIAAQPAAPTQTCRIVGGQGRVLSGDVRSIAVECDTDKFILGGLVTDLLGGGLVLANGKDEIEVSALGGFAFPTPISSGEAFAIRVVAQPKAPSQNCVVSFGEGIISDADFTSVSVECDLNQFPVQVSVEGMGGGTLVLQNNGGDDLLITGDGAYTFATPVASSATYDITVAAQPTWPWQTCTVRRGAGVVGAKMVDDITVTCTDDPHTVGGTVSGLHGVMVLLDADSDALTIEADGAFTFPNAVASGTDYRVTIGRQPEDQICTVSDGAGTIGAVDVTDVVITCKPATCRNQGWKTSTDDWSCPAGFRMPHADEYDRVTPCISDADAAQMNAYHDVGYDIGGCGCKWNPSWCEKPSIRTFNQGHACGDFTQLQICVVE